MNNERQNIAGMNRISFNPDAPTDDSDRQQYAQVETSTVSYPSQQGFSPDMPTTDADTKVFVPKSRKRAQKAQRPTYNPDAETLDDENEESVIHTQSHVAEASTAIKAESLTTGPVAPFVPMNSGRMNQQGQSASSSAMPFRPMGSHPNNGSTIAGMEHNQQSGSRIGIRPEPQMQPAPSTSSQRQPAPSASSQWQSSQGKISSAERPVQAMPVRQPVLDAVPSVASRQHVSSGQQQAPSKHVQSDRRSMTLQEMITAEERHYQGDIQQYEYRLSQWKKSIWIPFAVLIGDGGLCLLGGAFAGGLGVVVVAFGSVATVAILAATGKLKRFVKPRKPQKQTPKMETPELTSVYSVKLRLKSVNLPKPVEVTIRKEEQLLGCDAVLCLQPLAYKGVSHRHCTIISKHQHGHTTYFIRDEGSKNGTRLNDRKLDAGIEYPLQIGDVITLAGRYQFRVMSDAY